MDFLNHQAVQLITTSLALQTAVLPLAIAECMKNHKDYKLHVFSESVSFEDIPGKNVFNHLLASTNIASGLSQALVKLVIPPKPNISADEMGGIMRHVERDAAAAATRRVMGMK